MSKKLLLVNIKNKVKVRGETNEDSKPCLSHFLSSSSMRRQTTLSANIQEGDMLEITHKRSSNSNSSCSSRRWEKREKGKKDRYDGVSQKTFSQLQLYVRPYSKRDWNGRDIHRGGLAWLSCLYLLASTMLSLLRSHDWVATRWQFIVYFVIGHGPSIIGSVGGCEIYFIFFSFR